MGVPLVDITRVRGVNQELFEVIINEAVVYVNEKRGSECMSTYCMYIVKKQKGTRYTTPHRTPHPAELNKLKLQHLPANMVIWNNSTYIKPLDWPGSGIFYDFPHKVGQFHGVVTDPKAGRDIVHVAPEGPTTQKCGLGVTRISIAKMN